MKALPVLLVLLTGCAKPFADIRRFELREVTVIDTRDGKQTAVCNNPVPVRDVKHHGWILMCGHPGR